MLHWYCKATYNLGQFFFLKRHTIWDGGSSFFFFFLRQIGNIHVFVLKPLYLASILSLWKSCQTRVKMVGRQTKHWLNTFLLVRN